LVATSGGATTAYSLRALSSSTGATLWRATGVGGVYGGGPAVKDGIVYLAANRSGSEGGGGVVTALRASDGTKLWAKSAGDDVHSVAAVDGSRVYIGTIDGSVHAFSKSSGALAWASPATGEEIWSSISSANGVIYFTRDSGAVQALNASTGALLWSSSVTSDSAMMSSVAVVDGRIYVGGTNGLSVFGL
jgi:outer membrane protein assembly factor BamB